MCPDILNYADMINCTNVLNYAIKLKCADVLNFATMHSEILLIY